MVKNIHIKDIPCLSRLTNLKLGRGNASTRNVKSMLLLPTRHSTEDLGASSFTKGASIISIDNDAARVAYKNVMGNFK